MSTASIPELRKAQTRARAQLARAALRYGKRALARRGSGEGGPPSDREAALLRELLAAAETMTAAAREHRAAVNWQPQQQPWAGVAGANPDPLSGLWWAAFVLDTASASGDPAATVEAGQALGGGGDCDLRTRTEPAAPGPARRLTMPATRLRIPAEASSETNRAGLMTLSGRWRRWRRLVPRRIPRRRYGGRN